MSEIDDRCPRCGGSISKMGSGSITQWMASCRCQLSDAGVEDEFVEIEICKICKKRINQGRHGSFTQWIFRTDTCSCDSPQPQKIRTTPSRDVIPQLVPDSNSDGDEMKIDATKFPVERYKPLELLGSGASGSVYLCRDRVLSKRVAIKTLTFLTPEQMVAFQREAQATSRLSHPNVVGIFDFGVTNSGIPFMVMEYFAGETLAGLVAKHGALDVSVAVSVIAQVCRGLSAAHKTGIFHRDVKSSNILVAFEDDGPIAKLIDFGVAIFDQDNGSKTIQGITLVGTPQYMSPDQAAGLAYDERSEVYSVGCTLFEALTGTTPFVGETALEVINQHANSEAPLLSSARPDLEFPAEVEEIVARCLAKNRGDRFASISQLFERLSGLHSSAGADVAESAIPYGTERKTLRPILVPLAVLACLLVSFLIYRVIATKDTTLPPARLRVQMPPSQALVDDYDPVALGAIFISRKVNGVTYLVGTGNVDDEKLAGVAGKTGFTGLYLIGERITGVGFKNLAQSPIEFLCLSATSLTPQGYACLSGMQSLKDVYIGDTKLTEVELKHLSKLPRLEKLDLANSELSDSAFSALAGCGRLKHLSLRGVKRVSPAALLELSRAPCLEYLDLSYANNSKLTSAAVAQIQAKLPNCKVVAGK